MSAFEGHADPLPDYQSGTRPPSAAWMGMGLVDYWPNERRVRLSFQPNENMRNFGGTIQGGILAAMMDDAMGSLTFFALGGRFAPASIDLQTHFFAAVPLEPVEVEAQIIRAGKAIAFAEARLFRSDGQLAARAAGSMKLRPFQGLQFETKKGTA